MDIIKKLKNNIKKSGYLDNLNISELEDIITIASNEYYNKSKSIISDELFDLLIENLRIKSPTSPILNKIGAELLPKDKIKLDYWMGSMNKLKPNTQQLTDWFNSNAAPYSISEKLDGISGLLVYRNTNGLINLYTRGDGIEGSDISRLIPYLNIPSYSSVYEYCKQNNIQGKKNLIAFRGELILDKTSFQSKWKKTFATARACVASIVHKKKINILLLEDISIVFYEVVDPYFSLNLQYKILERLVLKTVKYKLTEELLNTDKLMKYLEWFTKKSLFEIDGIIVSKLTYERNNNSNPVYAFAFKYSNQYVRATVNNIEWNISKDGLMKPTIIVNPIIINNTTIKRTTGYNARYIVDNIIGIGSVIEIELSGGVIPNIVNIVKSSSNNKPDLPKGKWKWNDTKIDIILEDCNNKDMISKNLYHFFKFLKIKGIGQQTINKIYEAGYDDIVKILELKKEDLLSIETFKDKTVSNILTYLNKTKSILNNISLNKLMIASNKLGRGFGIEKINAMISKFPNIIEIYIKSKSSNSLDDLLDGLISIDGWNIKTAKAFIHSFPKFLIFYNTIKTYINIDYSKSEFNNISLSNYNSDIYNKIFVMTGFRDKDIYNTIVSNGGIVKDNISKKTNYLIVKNNNISENAKVIFAKQNNIKILTITELNNILYKL